MNTDLHISEQLNARQTEILAFVTKNGYAETDFLARQFSKTMQTIRRDFEKLESHGLVVKVHGGAKLATPAQFENLPYAERRRANIPQKQAIGAAAANLIPDGKCVFLSAGTSTEAVAVQMLSHQDMQFVTNNLNIAQHLRDNIQSSVQICGGDIRHEDGAVFDPRARDMIASMRIDYSVIGIGGIDPREGLFCYSIDEVMTARTIMQHSRHLIIVADDDKIGQQANFRLCSLSDIDTLITGVTDSTELEVACQDIDVELIRVKPDGV